MSGAAKNDKAPVNETKNGEQPAQDKKPAPLEEDDEFEDFPVEGRIIPLLRTNIFYRYILLTKIQIGPRRKPRFPTETRTFGRRAGMMMTQTMILQFS